jgi:hypothetical protein
LSAAHADEAILRKYLILNSIFSLKRLALCACVWLKHGARPKQGQRSALEASASRSLQIHDTGY